MRFFLSFLFALLLISTGVAVVTMSSAGQGDWKINLSLPHIGFGTSTADARSSVEQTVVTRPAPTKDQSQLPQRAVSANAQSTPPPGEPIGDWTFNCGANPQTSKKQCTIMQSLTDEKSNSVVFAWIIGDDGKGNLVGLWQTPTGVLINRGIVIDLGTEKPIAVPYTACITGHCEAVANLAPDFVETLTKAEKATATVFVVSGQGLTFNLSVKGLSDGIAALKRATTADG